MAYNSYAFRYTSGRASNLAALIWNRERTTLRNLAGADVTLTAIASVADATFSRGRLAATEKSTSTTGTGTYALASFPVLAAGFYAIDIYDVPTPSDSSPSPTDTPLAGDGTAIVYWDGVDLREESTEVIDLVENTTELVPDPGRTWVARRDPTDGTVGSTKAIPKQAAEVVRLYVDFSRMLGTNEALGATSTMTVGVGTSGCTAASSSFDKSGDIVSFSISGGSVSATAYDLTISIDSDTGDPISAIVKLKVI